MAPIYNKINYLYLFNVIILTQHKTIRLINYIIHLNLFHKYIQYKANKKTTIVTPSKKNMKKITQSILYTYGSIHQSPGNRISAAKILQNVQSHQLTHQLFNNMRIAVNCTKIAVKYSKCYMCRVPAFRYPLKKMYQMDKYDSVVKRIQDLFVQQCPIPKYKQLFKRFDYQNKGIYAALSLIQSENLTKQQQNSIVKFLTALELVNLGFSLHHSIGKSHKLNFVTRVALKMMSKQMKDSYLVLGGDYFHIKGSVLAAQIKNVALSKLLSQVQIDFCKCVHLTEQLKSKILTVGYDKVDIKEIYNISVLKTSPIVKGLLAVDIVLGKEGQHQILKKQVSQIIGLLMLYRKDLENFMFNFKDILKKYKQYTQNRINFDSEESLPYYIFFQGAQNNKRIDTSYLNTVTMMSEQIEFLQQKLKTLLGQQKAQQLQRKMGYYLMIYS